MIITNKVMFLMKQQTLIYLSLYSITFNQNVYFIYVFRLFILKNVNSYKFIKTANGFFEALSLSNQNAL